MWRGRLLALGCAVGAAEGCDLLIFRLRLKCLGKDRSLASLDSSYRPSGDSLATGPVSKIKEIKKPDSMVGLFHTQGFAYLARPL